MSETFREPTPEEVKNAVLQFMGQNIGELKQLDTHIIAKNATLQGLALQPQSILNTVEQALGPSAPPPQPVQTITSLPVQQLTVTIPAPQEALNVAPTLATDPNQLELNFNTSPYTESVFESLKKLENKMGTVLSILDKLNVIEQKLDTLLQSEDTKKKD
jgi:hypothetical protein